MISTASLGCVDTEPKVTLTPSPAPRPTQSTTPIPTPTLKPTQSTTPIPTPSTTPIPTPSTTPIPTPTLKPTPSTTPTSTTKLPLAPDFELIDATSGDLIRLSDYRGKVVLLDFFATWCGACKFTIDNDLVQLYEQYEDQVIFLSIDVKEPKIAPKELQTFAEEHEMGWPILMGSSSTVDRSYNVWILPTICLIDEDGAIRYFHLGSPGAKILKSEIDSLLY
ncbi:MAG: TlpA disulfide reductase family protein [Methanocellales archaeon]|nr:TlpA disulfide reductase family protein [Methanocellales archaeon]MDD3291229.1 TlpA disulfide reductase family protein [Methanocellales archaeon]MDD5235401.1 TlpA disulfide reductase family protein [Methanocellales archaeon]MDD5484516.1 TlpA disulfide reductase family protein [Methanocellales archaeon]